MHASGDVVGGDKFGGHKIVVAGDNWQAPRFHSTIPSLRGRPFVGRDDLLTEMAERLGDPASDAVIVLRGQAGVGKSELAQEFARRRRQSYSGGTFLLDGGGPLLAAGLVQLGQSVLGLAYPPHMDIRDQGLRALYSLGPAPVLLIYDNVQSESVIQEWLPKAGMACHVIITTLLDRWDVGWSPIEVMPLLPEKAVELVARTASPSLARRHGARLADIAGGLPVQLVSVCSLLVREERRGRDPAPFLDSLTPETESSFRAVHGLLSSPCQLVVHAAARLNPQQIPSDELRRHIVTATGWSDSEFQRHLDACLDLQVLQGIGDLRMHQLFATFLLNTAASESIATQVAAVTTSQANRMLEVARELLAQPGSAELAALLMMFSPNPDRWCQQDGSLSVSDGEVVGRALLEIGAFQAAQPWFERATTAKEQGDVHGRVNHESLSFSLHQVGHCLASLGRFEAAQPWFERAVDAQEQGDIHGRIDHESLGRSLNQVRHCLSSLERFEAAQPWFERAVAAKEQGDIHGRVDHASLGASLNQVGHCLSSLGRFEAAQPWFERAVAAKEQGDIHGRIDHESLGRSLNQMGHCLSSLARFEAAQPWFERAVDAQEQGDIHGRIDHESLGRSLNQVGHCLSSLGRFEAAQPWFERAVDAQEQGDIHGRVDHASLGVSLHQVGHCLASLGRFEAAQPWFERAVAEKEHGNIYGRVDHESLGVSLRVGAGCLRQLQQHETAADWEERAFRLSEIAAR